MTPREFKKTIEKKDWITDSLNSGITAIWIFTGLFAFYKTTMRVVDGELAVGEGAIGLLMFSILFFVPGYFMVWTARNEYKVNIWNSQLSKDEKLKRFKSALEDHSIDVLKHENPLIIKVITKGWRNHLKIYLHIEDDKVLYNVQECYWGAKRIISLGVGHRFQKKLRKCLDNLPDQ